MKGKQLSRRIAVLAVLIGLSTLGRFLFAWLPGFKPLGAFAILAGMYLGWQSGFLVGALSIVVSNFYFGHGPWTLFQIGALGLIGLMAGVLGPILRRNRILLVVYGIFAAFLFSGVMDLWTAFWLGGGWMRYFALCVAAMPFTVIYACSNVLFLWLLVKPVGKVLTRMQVKYGV